MKHQIRCEHKMHGILVEPGVIEIKCDSKFCGAGPGITVLHRFDANTGNMLRTDRYANPPGRVE